MCDVIGSAMTQSGDAPGAGKTPSSFKWLAGAIPLVAALIAIIGAFEHWFGGGTAAEPASPVAEYAAVCNLSNSRQQEREQDLAQFRVAFERARDPTKARDAMLLLTKQDIAATSELQNRIQALTPPQNHTSDQHQLEADLKANLAALVKYQGRLGAGISSVAQLVTIAASLPRSSIESRDIDARGRLLRLGTPDCILSQEHEQPIADWSSVLRTELAAAGPRVTQMLPTASSPHRSVATSGATVSGQDTGQPSVAPVAEAENTEPLPEAELPSAAKPIQQQSLTHHQDNTTATTQAAGASSETSGGG